MSWVMFGHSHLFGDIFDLIDNADGKLSKIVMNVPEAPIPGRPTLAERLGRLPYPVEIVQLQDWKPGLGEHYVIGFTGIKMKPLADDLRTRFDLRFRDLIHSKSILQYGARVSEGTLVDAGAIMGSWSQAGRHVILNRGSNVGHDCEIGNYSFLAPGATLCGHVRLEEGVFIGANAVVIPDITVGMGSVVAAGAAVTHNIPPFAMVAGVPAVYVKKV